MLFEKILSDYNHMLIHSSSSSVGDTNDLDEAKGVQSMVPINALPQVGSYSS